MKNIFNSVSVRRPKKSKFDLTHERKLSMNMGNLVPIMFEEILPGDRFRVSTEILMRFAPLLAPVMHRINVWTHYYFVPYRLIWDEWEDFITGGPDGTLSPVPPTLEWQSGAGSYPQLQYSGLADYMGLPSTDGTLAGASWPVSALPFRAYQLIYDQNFRDKKLTPAVDCTTASGPELIGSAEWLKAMELRKRCWEPDYYTTSLSSPIVGGSVAAPITYDEGVPTKAVTYGSNVPATPGALETAAGEVVTNPSSGESIRFETDGGVMISMLRKAEALQLWLEKNARGGARYVDQMLQHFGVTSSDARLQLPEYLGGGMSPCVISEVLSSFQQVGGTIPQGHMAGHGLAVGNTHGFTRTFEEHGCVIGIMSVLPRTAYQQGIPRKFRRMDKFDYAFPEFAHIGDQEVKTSELFIDNTVTPTADPVFGYQSRFSEMKYGCSSVHGDFRGPLAYWHDGRIFSAPPVLNDSFVTSDPSDRIFAVTSPTEDKLYCQLLNKIDAIRPLPYYGDPR